ncbi:hypothetical protein [Streptomyces soliscabiei]|uniref:hypothetical protein n=1 Tax=Streptomyces soliscabiei TaxID=588897 RepID=UPI0029B1C6DD|nr:hypothetical protein [Streptomyces sp. NY05-11A]MDX2681652.1 hypothetical protein [Streptomyces sp. NY05-11A]
MDRPIDGHETDGVTGEAGHHTPLPGKQIRDRHWAADMRSAIRCTSAFLGLLLLADAAAGTFTALRAVLWSGLALLLFLVLMPTRVTAGEGWLAVRTLSGTRRVRTDRLVSVRTTGRAGQRLMLRDALGGGVEFDTQALVANPALWHRLDADARVSTARGHTARHLAALSALATRIDRETAWTVFKVSGLAAESPDPPAH